MSKPDPIWHEFPDRLTLAGALAGDIAARLAAATEQQGEAVLVLSGGNTPGLFFDALSRERIDWRKVTVTLADERFVPPDHPRSNERLVRERLLQGNAADGRFLPLHVEGVDAAEAARLASARIEALPQPFPAVLLGMGLDGHTASIFPEADNLAQLLDPDAAPVLPVRAAAAGEPRLSLSLAWLLKASHIVLHIEGAEKKALLEQILSGRVSPEPPVGAIFRQATIPVQVYWAPSGD